MGEQPARVGAAKAMAQRGNCPSSTISPFRLRPRILVSAIHNDE